MDAWMARLEDARQAFLDDDDEDEANMAMALYQLQYNMDVPPPAELWQGVRAKGREQT